MKWLESRLLWGFVLILGGVALLLENLNILHIGSLFWALLFTLLGLYFMGVFFTNRGNWWALIPGAILLDLALVITLETLFARLADIWSGPLVLAGIGLSFFLVYLARRSYWWAVIPGGLLLTLAVVAAADSFTRRIETGGIFFLGLGLTFALVAVLPVPEEGEPTYLRWAFIPAGILLLIGVLVLVTSSTLVNYLWLLALILAGAYLLYRTFASRST